jgi:hypothetical protein
MLLTIPCMLPSALARFPLITMNNMRILLGFNLFVFVCIAIDSLHNRRLHLAFGWGATSLLAAISLAFCVAYTPAWIQFGTWLVT